MKKYRFIPLIMAIPFLLGACDLLKYFQPVASNSTSDSTSSHSGGESSDSEFSSDSSESSETSSTSSSSVENKKLNSIALEGYKENYYTGDTFNTSFQANISLNFSDGSSEIVGLDSEYITAVSYRSFSSKDSYSCSASTPVEKAGEYTANVRVTAKVNNVTKRADFNGLDLTFNSVFEVAIDTCTNLVAETDVLYKKDDVVKDNIDMNLTFTWTHHGTEKYHINSLHENLDFYLYRDGDNTINKINDPLIAGEYELIVSYSGTQSTIPFTITEALGYRRIEAEDLTATNYYVDEANSPIVSNPKILVIPINLPASSSSNIQNWTTSSVNTLNDYYFGSSPTSFVNYYKTMSYNKMNFSGMVSSIYVETSNDYSVENINDDDSSNTLYEMMDRAVKATMDKYPSIDWSEYDQNDDKYFDNIHFLTNYKATTWAGPLWPHMSQADNISGTLSKPGVCTYSIGAINHMDSSITQIHEQGHIFGLLDYYDYTNSCGTEINYVGGADMQSHNVFDWNSYSKLSCGLMSPYVVDGTLNSFEITINDAATSGDCIIVPADYSTWNGSAFDEYFLIELFSNKGLNSQFWSSYQSNYGVSLGDGGIRLYHVDSRLFNLYKSGSSYHNGQEVSLDKSTWHQVTIGPNNSSDYTATGYGDYNPPACSDMKLLSIIQKGGVDTFGKDQVAMLKEADLFETGDTFTFDQYKHFLSKSGEIVSSMDNGETFPWTIEFKSVTPNIATIRFSK